MTNSDASENAIDKVCKWCYTLSMNQNLIKPVLTVKEVKAMLRCGLSQIYDLFNSGDLLGFRVGAAVRIYEESVFDYIRKTSNLPKPPKPEVDEVPQQPKASQGKRRSHSTEVESFPLLGV